MNLRRGNFNSEFNLPDGYESRLFVVPKVVVPPKGLKQKLEGILSELRQRLTLMGFCIDLFRDAQTRHRDAVVLHHLIEISGWGTRKDGFVYKVNSELEAEIGMSSGQLDSFRKRWCYNAKPAEKMPKRNGELVDVWKTNAEARPVWHFRVNVSALVVELAKYIRRNCRIGDIPRDLKNVFKGYRTLENSISGVLQGDYETLQDSISGVSDSDFGNVQESITGQNTEANSEQNTGIEAEDKKESVCLSESVLNALGSRGVIVASAVKAWTVKYGLSLEKITDDVVSAALDDSSARGAVLIGVIANKAISPPQSLTGQLPQGVGGAIETGFCPECGAVFTGGRLCDDCAEMIQAQEEIPESGIRYEYEEVNGLWRWTIFVDGIVLQSGGNCMTEAIAQQVAESFMNVRVKL